jgi:protein arginine kinase activator
MEENAMMCERCKKNEATVHFMQTVNGVKSEMLLCSECAEKENKYSFFSDDLFSGFFTDSILGLRRSGAEKKCELCGLTRRELASNGRPGCAKCYEVFADELDKIIYGIHGNAKHNGALPGKHAENLEEQKKLDALKKEIQALKEEQKNAIAEQNYERAAEIRDRLRQIEEEGGKC